MYKERALPFDMVVTASHREYSPSLPSERA